MEHATCRPRPCFPLGVAVLVPVALGVLACSERRNNSSYSAEGASDAVAIIATDEGHAAPDTIPAGMTHIAFHNRGTSIHEVMFVRLPDGMNAEAYAAEVRSGIDFPEGAIDCSGIGLTSPGESSEAWLELEAGTYILVCWFRDHSDAVAPAIVVQGVRDRDVPPPRTDVTIRLIDFRFEVIGTIRSGDNVLKVETVGPSMHEVDIFRLEEGKTIDDLRAWQKGGKAGPAPARAVGGVLDSHDIGRPVWFKRSFAPGRYVLWCNMDMIQNAGVNDPHVTHADAGMFHEFELGR